MVDRKRYVGRLVAASALALVMASKAYGQAVAASRVAPRAEPLALDEVIVTATKREARLQDVPLSITVVGQVQMQRTGTLSTADLPNLAPGLYYAPSVSPKTSQFVLRGVGTFAVTDALEPSVGVTVDGVPIARVSGAVTDMVDVDHIEVLKGPQGTLFGKNATAGVISIVTKQPRLGETSLEGNISYGSYNEFNADIAQNIALSDFAAARITAWRYGHDGFIKGATDGRRYNDKNSFGVRLGLTLVPNERLKYTLIGQYDGRDQNGTAYTAWGFTSRTPAAIVNQARALGIVPGPANRVAEFSAQPYDKANNYYVTGVGEYDLGGGYQLSSLTSYREVSLKNQFDSFGTSSPIYRLSRLENPEKYHTFSQELRVASPTDQRLSFVAGLFYYRFSVTDILFQTTEGLLVPGIIPGSTVSHAAIINPAHVETVNYAAFGEVTFRVTPNLRLLAGLRQSHDDLKGAFNRTYIDTPVLPVPATVTPVTYTASGRDYDFTSYRIGAQYDVRPGMMLYATASRGYKGPGFNFTPSLTAAQVASFGADVEAETVRSYEAGLKGEFLDRRVIMNLALFHSTFSNFQTTVALSFVPTVFAIRNAKELQSKGVEFELTALPTRGLTIGLNGAYSDAKFTDYRNASCYGGEPTLPAGSPLTPGFCVGGIQNLNGAQLPQSPKWVLNGNLRYETDLGADWTGFVTTDVSYKSKILFEGLNDPLSSQKGYTLVNATLGLGPRDGRWAASVYVRNIFDKDFVARRRDFQGYYQQYIPYEANRRMGASLNFRY